MIQNCLQISSIIFLLGVIIQVPANPYIIVQRWDDEIPLLDAVTGTPYKNCGGSESVLKSVTVTPCNAQDSDHCVITRGNNVTFNMKFLSKINSSTLQAKIYGIYDFIPVPFPCPKPDACQDSGITCPIAKGQFYNYTLEAQTLTNYPKMSLWVKGELKDDHGNILVCVKVPVTLV